MRRLRKLRVPFVAVNLSPLFGDIDDYAGQVETAVSRLITLSGPPLIIAHSMGGLVARVWLRRFGQGRRCAGIVTIGTPHNGTWLARFAFSTNSRQMRRGEPWLTTLNEQVRPTEDVPFECYYSNCDNIVFPAYTATLPGAENIHLEGWAHMHMLGNPVLFERVLKTLDHLSDMPRNDRCGELG